MITFTSAELLNSNILQQRLRGAVFNYATNNIFHNEHNRLVITADKAVDTDLLPNTDYTIIDVRYIDEIYKLVLNRVGKYMTVYCDATTFLIFMQHIETTLPEVGELVNMLTSTLKFVDLININTTTEIMLNLEEQSDTLANFNAEVLTSNVVFNDDQLIDISAVLNVSSSVNAVLEVSLYKQSTQALITRYLNVVGGFGSIELTMNAVKVTAGNTLSIGVKKVGIAGDTLMNVNSSMLRIIRSAYQNQLA